MIRVNHPAVPSPSSRLSVALKYFPPKQVPLWILHRSHMQGTLNLPPALLYLRFSQELPLLFSLHGIQMAVTAKTGLRHCNHCVYSLKWF